MGLNQAQDVLTYAQSFFENTYAPITTELWVDTK